MAANQLIHEKSPYLRQHAHNPVDWVPWSDEAFERARREDRPVFLSIGYSTCHWCHVMERESFENEQVADLMNRAFVNIKVDREERPDIDAFYMAVCQVMTGSGGWPLTIIATPDREAFFAGTYFPVTQRWGRIGMLELIPRITDLWEHHREEIRASAVQLTDEVRRAQKVTSESDVDTGLLDRAVLEYRHQFDSQNGGFGGAPKFPSAHQIVFLLEYAVMKSDHVAKEMACSTLRAIRFGGIYDQIGFGVHRYSTDERWHVPHFEKMLYDQAMALMAYSLAFRLTEEALFARTCSEIFEYICGRLRGTEGGFFSAEDADSDGIEGRYYVWTIAELMDVLGNPDDVSVIIDRFGLSQQGDLDEIPGANVLRLPFDHTHKDVDVVPDTDRILRKLLRARDGRSAPFLDEKIMTDWNGLMIAALAVTGRNVQDSRFITEASRTAEFILRNLIDEDGHLMHRWCDGNAAITAMASDYAYLAWGMIELYEATYEKRWLDAASVYLNQLLDRFYDEESGVFFISDSKSDRLPVRIRDTYDGAIPSINSVLAFAFHRAGAHLEMKHWEDIARRIITQQMPSVRRNPTSYSFLLRALLHLTAPQYHISIHENQDRQGFDAFLKVIEPFRVPGLIVTGFRSGDQSNRAVVVPCYDQFCSQPVYQTDDLVTWLETVVTKRGNMT